MPGAGVTHCLSGVAEAFMDNVPLVVLTCGIRIDTGKAFQLHDVDQLAILRPITKAVLHAVKAEDVYALARSAFAIARSGAPGPVALEIPANLYVLSQEVEAIAPAQPPESLPACSLTRATQRSMWVTARATPVRGQSSSRNVSARPWRARSRARASSRNATPTIYGMDSAPPRPRLQHSALRYAAAVGE